MSVTPEAAHSDRDLAGKHSESAARESALQDGSLHAPSGLSAVLGAAGQDERNPRLASSPLLQRKANGETRIQILRRYQQGSGNHKTQQLVAQFRRSPVVQRECSCGGTCSACQEKGVSEEEGLHVLQRSGFGTGGGTVDAEVIPAGSTGHPLDQPTRALMEPRFGQNFSDVRVHSDGAAAQSAESLSADAYTTGRDIYFASGKYAPASQEGQHLLAHELTHTVQQANGATVMAASPVGGVLVGDAADPLETEAEQTADNVTTGTAHGPTLSGDQSGTVRRDLGSTATAVWDATGGRAVKAAGEVWDEAKESLSSVIERLAPGLLALLRNAGTALYQKITAGMDGMFNGIASRVQNQGLVGAITGILGDIAGSLGKSLAQLVTGSCQSMADAASSLIHFVKEVAGDAFTELSKVAKEVGDYFSGLWQDYGAPALEAIKKVAGEAWGWIKEKAQWVWDKLLPIRNGLSTAWNWIKKEFNLAKDDAVGVLDWLGDKAKEQWMKIRDKIAPILGPLKMVAGALLLLSPLGPIILIWKGAPLLWQALQYIWAHGLKPASEWIRKEFREHILPGILDGISAISAKLDQASDFLCRHAGTISTGLHSLEDALGKLPFLQTPSRIVGAAAGFFDKLAAKGKCKFSDVIAEVKAVLNRIHEFLKPVLEALRQAALIAAFGGWAILDDGVWKTLNQFVALAKKTPCIRELAGLLQVDTVMEKVGAIRATLKDVYAVLSDQKKVEAKIHQALDGLLALIPGKAEAILGATQGLDARHLDILLKRFIAPKLAETISKAPTILIQVAWSLVWPWDSVIPQYQEAAKEVDKFKASLWDFEFSKAMDSGLKIWRDVNGIIGALYGWFFLASVLIGSIFGAPEAGAAVAYEVGEVLLTSTLLAEGLSIEKAKLNLMTPSRMAKPESERIEEDKEDYQTLSGSMMNLAMMGALAVLSEIAVDFAKAVFSEIKDVFLPEGAEAPKADINAKSSPTEKPAEPGANGAEENAPKPDEPAKEIPPAELKAEIEELRQKAADPDNVRRPSDPSKDAAMDADGHEFDRNKEERSWCRHSEEVCDINVGDDVNAKVDEALEKEAAPIPGTPEPSPLSEPPKSLPEEPGATDSASDTPTNDESSPENKKEPSGGKRARSAASKRGIELRKKMAYERMSNGEYDPLQDLLTADERAQFIDSGGKDLPKDIDWHHTRQTSADPGMADVPEHIQPVRYTEHMYGEHGGQPANVPTAGIRGDVTSPSSPIYDPNSPEAQTGRYHPDEPTGSPTPGEQGFSEGDFSKRRSPNFRDIGKVTDPALKPDFDYQVKTEKGTFRHEIATGKWILFP